MSADGNNHKSPCSRDSASWLTRVLRRLGLGRAGGCTAKLTLDEQLQIAYRVSADGDLTHAAHHLAGALQADCGDARCLQSLERLIAKQESSGGDPLALAPVGRKGTFSGTLAMRAYMLHRQRQVTEAFVVLRQIAQGDPKARWWRWGVQWLGDSETVASLPPVHVVGLLWSAVEYADEQGGAAAGVSTLEQVLPIAQTVAQAHPKMASAQMLHVAVLRRLGRHDEACRIAERVWEELPDYMTAIARATAHQAAGHVDTAAEAYKAAYRLQPDDPSAPADLAELLASARRFEAALHWAEEARTRDPERTTSAWPLSYLLRHAVQRDDSWLEVLSEFTKQHPQHRRPSWEAMLHLGDYATILPSPSEATINTMRQVAGKVDGDIAGGSVNLTVSCIEAPSSYLSSARYLQRHGVALELAVQSIPSPDPREPLATVEWKLWEFTGAVPRPGLGPPEPGIGAAVAELAAGWYDLQEWSEAARIAIAKLAAACPNKHALVESILALMVNPPPAPDALPDWDWTRRIQFAAALMVAHADQGWTESVRRRGIEAMILGPVDWTTEAGIVALTVVMNEPGLDENSQAMMFSLLQMRAQNIPEGGYCCYEEALAWAVMRMPASLRRRAADSWNSFWERRRSG